MCVFFFPPSTLLLFAGVGCLCIMAGSCAYPEPGHGVLVTHCDSNRSRLTVEGESRNLCVDYFGFGLL